MKNPRVAIYYNNKFGRNDGPPLYYFNVLKEQLKYDTTHLIPEGDTTKFGKFDLHFWIDWGEDGLPVDYTWMPPKDRGQTIYVVSDAHIDEKGRNYRFTRAREFDYVFFNQSWFVEEYKTFNPAWEKDNKYVGFLPHAAEPQAYPHFEIIPKYDVCFIGHLQDVKNFNGFSRIDMLDRAFKEFPNFYFGTRDPANPQKNMFEDAAKHFCESKVVLNISIGDDLNMRLFEILSSGSFQLTNWLPAMVELGIEDGKQLVTYKTLDEMVKKIQYYLAHDAKREAIAREGHRWFLSQHTYKHRVQTILDIIYGSR